jgi:formylmethanofuran dehydrogenase subunit C
MRLKGSSEAGGLRARQLAASKRFKGYQEEQKRLLRRNDVKPDKTSRNLLKALNASSELGLTISNPFDMDWGIDDTFYLYLTEGFMDPVYICYPFIHGLDYGKDDIERFTLLLDDRLQDASRMMATYFLQALIRLHRMDIYTLHMPNGEESPDFIGRGNRAILNIYGDTGRNLADSMSDGVIMLHGSAGHSAGEFLRGGLLMINGDCCSYIGRESSGLIIIDGNAGDSAGVDMKEGVLIIKGDADETLGSHMKAGTLIADGDAGDYAGNMMAGEYAFLSIRGDAGHFLGSQMSQGRIKVFGNAGKNVGEGMRGGEIHIEGDIGAISPYIKKGKIFHKGKLIVDK